MSVTTLGIFQSLLNRSVTDDASLDDVTRASIITRVNQLARDQRLLFDAQNVESTQGLVTVDDAAGSIEVATGATGTNRVVWDPMQFTVPVDIDGGSGERGFLPGHGGESANSLVALADISLQYRLAAGDTWKPFTRNTRLNGVSYFQLAADIADQGSDAALPQVNLVAVQI